MSAQKIHLRKSHSASVTQHKHAPGARSDYSTLSTNEENNQVKTKFKRGSKTLPGQNKRRHIENFASATKQEQQKPNLLAFPGKTENICESTEKKLSQDILLEREKVTRNFPASFWYNNMPSTYSAWHGAAPWVPRKRCTTRKGWQLFFRTSQIRIEECLSSCCCLFWRPLH